tara:strand:- start:178 stop:381 length:204 start_codon:yes stop_codon:yes gene_type:complete
MRVIAHGVNVTRTVDMVGGSATLPLGSVTGCLRCNLLTRGRKLKLSARSIALQMFLIHLLRLGEIVM